MTKYNGGEGSMSQEQGPSKGVFPSSLDTNKGITTFGITTEKPPKTNIDFNDERRISFKPATETVSEDVSQARKLWEDKETVVDPKKSLIKRLAGNLYLRIALGIAAGGLGYVAADQAYRNVPAVHQSTDNALEKVGLKVVVPPTFDNKAEENVLGKNNSFYVTPEEYKEKGPPTVEGNHVNVPFFIRFNDGKEHIISVKRHGQDAWDISGDIQGGEVLVPAKEDGEIRGGGGNEGFAYLYKPGMSFSRFSSWQISLADEKGGKIYFIITTGALQTSKDLHLQQDKLPKSFTGIGTVKGFASIGTLLDNQPVFIASNTITPENKFNGAYTDIATIPTGQAYGIK